jgi:hypothetical protein
MKINPNQSYNFNIKKHYLLLSIYDLHSKNKMKDHLQTRI